MAELRIRIKNKAGEILAESYGEDEICLDYHKEYQEGDTVCFETSQPGRHYVLQADDALGEALVYVTRPEVVYRIPFGEKRISYSPKVFSGSGHLLTARTAGEEQVSCYRNLALNVMDQHGDPGCYPHASANVETRGESVFAARNAIDGVRANRSHGAWPFESWGINRQDDAQLTLEFGRTVEIDKIVLCTRADFPHDNWWEKATFHFSDGSAETVSMKKSDKPHVFSFPPKKIEWLKLGELIKADDPSPFPALTQIEVYGKDAVEPDHCI